MNDLAIQISGLSKRYRIGMREMYPTLRESIVRAASAPLRKVRSWASRRDNRNTRGWIWALRDIDLEVKQGEIIGFIGRNGAGKSTLLKLLTGITEPTTGYADIYGRVGSLLEVGTGFHPELTGRENIYLNGAIIGMKKAEIKRKFDEIVAFSEVEKFLDTPVKRYSSGMFIRLAFGVAAHLEPEILIVDEVLAVGDAAFQKKCLGKMSDVASMGRTVLFVSHNMSTIQVLCKKTIWLEAGRLKDLGPTSQIVQRYLESTADNLTVSLADRQDRKGDGSARVSSLNICSEDDQPVIRTGSRLKITVTYTSDKPLRYPRIYVSIYDMSHSGIYALDSEATGDLPEVLPSKGALTCVTDPINLTPGRCYVSVGLYKAGEMVDRVESAAHMDVEAAPSTGSGRGPTRDWVICTLGYRWFIGKGAP